MVNNAPEWARTGAIYQIFPDRFHNGNTTNDPAEIADWDNEQPTRVNFFGGDLEGISQKLDYIQSLGVNAIYLTPIFSAPSNHKYDTRDYYRVDKVFGGSHALRALVGDLHSRGMRLILDGVFNHSGEEFFAFQDVVNKGEASTYADWFTVLDFPITKDPLSYLCCGDADYLPKLNHGNPDLKAYFLEVGTYWIEEYGIDGWRLDVPFKVPTSFWREFRARVKAAKSNAFLFGEVWRDGAPWVGGDIFDGVTNYPLRDLILDFCLNDFLDGEDYLFETNALRESLGDAAYSMVNLLGSHDTPRILTVFDQDVDRTLLSWVLLLTEVGIPLIYYGDEVGLLGGNDPDCRRPMIWDEDKTISKILTTIQVLLSLRGRSKAITRGSSEPLFSFVGLAAYKRHFQDQEIIVIVNAREAVHNIRIPVKSNRTEYFDLFRDETVSVDGGHIHYKVFPSCDFRVLTSHKD